jgi:hypothetical protein
LAQDAIALESARRRKLDELRAALDSVARCCDEVERRSRMIAASLASSRDRGQTEGAETRFAVCIAAGLLKTRGPGPSA